MIKFLQNENIFESHCEAIICPCNCKGKMGAGLALEFKNRFPDMFIEYKELCDKRALVPGLLHIYEREPTLYQHVLPKYIINFPTKDDWRQPSKLIYITTGLYTLQTKIKELNIKSVALPALGCGLGGLEYTEVKYYIEQSYQFLNQPEVLYEVYEPHK